ncbi:MAG: flagellar biosynthesis protein FlhB [Acidimicrobiia bacterium]
MAGDTSQKTEAPTPRRRREAREKGQVAKSADLSTWAGMLGAVVLLQISVTRGASSMRGLLLDMGQTIAHPDQAADMRFVGEAALKGAGVLAPILIGMMLIGVVVGLGQVGLRPAVKKLKPDFGRLNLFKGLKRMFGAEVWWEIVKSIAKIALLVAIAWPAIAHTIASLTLTSNGSLQGLATISASTVLTMFRNVAIGGLAIGGIDYLVQRRRLMKQLKMSRHEIKEEMKQHEGNPTVKRAIRSRQMSISRNRMIGLVSSSDVVVVNPTHYAVALKYESARGAPQVIAKGAGDIAKRIRTEAEAHGVPIVHEPVLTRTLYWACELGQLIPADLYEAVAQLLAFVFGLRAKGRAYGYHELPKPAVL